MSPMLLALVLLRQDATPVYLDTHQTPQVRAADLVSRMTLDEKIGQMMHEAPAIPRLGVKKYNWWSEALHGVARDNVTVFPQAIGNAATFDASLMKTMSTAISDEARAQYNVAKPLHPNDDLGLDFWTPNINIFRDPRWGRGQETYGEDPFLTGRMAVSFISGMQGDDPKHLKTVSTPKHFAVHSGPDPLRHQFDARLNLREIWMTYLPAFEVAITEGGAWSTMSSYNRLNGFPNSANPWLLQQTLRERWGFPGYVVSDCGAIDDIYQTHKFVPTQAEAAAKAVLAGCDLECGSSYQGLKEAVEKKLLPESAIDKSLARLMEARIRLGMFDATTPYDGIPASVIDSAEHRALARKLADESIVLLKNDRGLLPLRNDYKTIAVIGPNAASYMALYGNYNGTNKHMVLPVEGIRDAVGPRAKVVYAQGCRIDGTEDLVPVKFASLSAEVFPNIDLQGLGTTFQPPHGTINLDSEGGALYPNGPSRNYSVRYKGTLVAPVTGRYKLGMTCDDGMRVYLDGKKILEDWRVGAARSSSVEVELKKGQSYQVVAEFYQAAGQAVAKLEWAAPNTKPFDEAMTAAHDADLIVFVGGIDETIEGEEHDRADIQLPAVQQDLIKKLAGLHKPMVLVYENGGAVSFAWAKEQIPAIVEAWYPGEEGGNAIADVLFGKVSPSGRMPVTVYQSIADLPAYDDYRNAGHTYRFSTATPEWSFGDGLSYSRFRIDQVMVPSTLAVGDSLVVRARVTNTGSMEADEVVQLYLKHGKPSEPMPLKELKAFGRVHLMPGESQVVTLTVPIRELAVLHSDTTYWLEPEPLSVYVGEHQPKGRESGWKSVVQVGEARKLEFPKSRMRD